jgi:FkbM family methyltransferase
VEDNSMNLLELVGKKTYIYGTGKFASRIKGVLEKENIEVLAFLELNKKISTFEQIPVINSDNFENLDKVFPVIVGLGNPQADIHVVISSLKKLTFKIINAVQFANSALNSGHVFENYWLTGDLNIYENNSLEISRAREKLGDLESKNIYDEVIEYRKTGKIEALPQKISSKLQYLAPNLPWLGFLQNPIRVLDGGAFDGDTYENFQNLGLKIEYWNFIEPDISNYQKIKTKFADKTSGLIFTHAALSDCDGKVLFESTSNSDNGSRISLSGGEFVDISKVDSLPDAKIFNFIKFDIEGEELKALAGAKETIIVSRPVLAISTYHAPTHHWQILNYLGGFLRNYSFYLRVHGEQTFDVILYAFPNDM